MADTFDSGTPRRRHEDFVTYREMVEYVAEHDATMHTARAESLIFIGNALEKMDKRQEAHEQYHREFLQGIIDTLKKQMNQGQTSRLTVVSILIASFGIVTSAIVGIVALTMHH